jgi:hypothetical protein
MLKVLPLNETDYDQHLYKWWKQWSFEPVSKEFLPDDGKGGLMIYDDDTPVCAGFIYLTNSKVAWVDWIVSNKEYRKKPERKLAIDLLITTLTGIAKNSGCKYSYALIKNDKLIDIYEKLGYTKGISYNQELFKYL